MKNSLPHFKLAALTSYSTSILTESEYASKDEIAVIIAMASVYNDLKDYSWMLTILEEGFESTSEVSGPQGQYSGMSVFVAKKMISVIHEFLILIDENKKALELPFFRYILRGVADSNLTHWNDLKKIAINGKANQSSKNKNTLNALLRIRNNVGSHYYSVKNFYSGFQNYAASESSSIYTSFGDTLMQTRFYFADAAVEHIMRRQTDLSELKIDDLMSYTKSMNRSLRFIVESFLEHHNQILNGNRDERKYHAKAYSNSKRKASCR